MEIEKIIYNTTRELHGIEDRLSIAVIFLFCWKAGSLKFSELLYSENHNDFIKELNEEFSKYDVDFTIRLDNINVKSSFFKTIASVKDKYDSNGYYKALNNGDKYAMAVNEVVDFNFSKVKFNKMVIDINRQLTLNI